MIRSLHTAVFLALFAFASAGAAAQQPTAVQQQAANAAALGQGQVPTATGAISALAQIDAGAPAAAGADAAAPATAAANPGAVPGVTPTSAPAPEDPPSDIQKPFNRSLFFSKKDLVQIIKALDGKAPCLDCTTTGGTEIIPLVRTITLTGVLYKSPNDWLIWLNGQKLNPNNLLKEILDIEVYKDSRVRLKWYDIGLDGVIDITMRPHQKYDIVTGLMLPVPPEQ